MSYMAHICQNVCHIWNIYVLHICAAYMWYICWHICRHIWRHICYIYVCSVWERYARRTHNEFANMNGNLRRITRNESSQLWTVMLLERWSQTKWIGCTELRGYIATRSCKIPGESQRPSEPAELPVSHSGKFLHRVTWRCWVSDWYQLWRRVINLARCGESIIARSEAWRRRVSEESIIAPGALLGINYRAGNKSVTHSRAINYRAVGRHAVGNQLSRTG